MNPAFGYVDDGWTHWVSRKKYRGAEFIGFTKMIKSVFEFARDEMKYVLNLERMAEHIHIVFCIAKRSVMKMLLVL